MKISITGGAPRWGGVCPVCGQTVSSSRLHDAVLGIDDGKHVVLHTACAGGRWKCKVRGRVWSGPTTVTVDS